MPSAKPRSSLTASDLAFACATGSKFADFSSAALIPASGSIVGAAGGTTAGEGLAAVTVSSNLAIRSLTNLPCSSKLGPVTVGKLAIPLTSTSREGGVVAARPFISSSCMFNGASLRVTVA